MTGGNLQGVFPFTMMEAQNIIKLEQAIRSKEAADDHLRTAVLDVAGKGSVRAAAAAVGVAAGTLDLWKRIKGTPSLRVAKAVLKKVKGRRAKE